jgi:hypothetical protein
VALNPTALPRAWVAYDWRPSSSRTAALETTLASSTSSLLTRPVIEGAPSPPPKAAATTQATVVGDGTEGVTVRTVTPRAGYLILDDSAYPGRNASLDGRPVPWLPANENFRAVAIPAGSHVVSFKYSPKSVLWGAIVATLCLVAIVVLAVIGVMRRRRIPAAAPDRGSHAVSAAAAKSVSDR